MDNEEAKFILRAYRPNGADANDPMFSRALEQAKRDPELGRWLEREVALDRDIVKKVSAIAPPADLREAILAGGSVSARAQQKWWRQPRWLMAAASIVLLMGLGLSWPRVATANAARRFGNFAINDFLSADHSSTAWGTKQFAEILGDGSRKLSSGLPIAFEELRANGCRTINFFGYDVLEVCFLRDGVEYHAYVMKRPHDKRMELREPHFAKGERNTVAAVWSDDRYVYALVSGNGVDAVRALL
jgi:hypothetical protein